MGETEFFIEQDVINLSGDAILKRIVNKGKKLYLDIEEIERKADDKSEIHQEQFIEALKYIHSGTLNSNKTGIKFEKGEILWNIKNLKEENKKKLNHITKKEGKRSKLKREGYLTEYPKFLAYGSEIFENGLIDIQYNKKITPNLNIEELEDIMGIEAQNNQLIRLNTSNEHVYKVDYALEKFGKSERYRINEDHYNLKQMVRNHYGNSIGFTPRNIEQELGIQMLLDRNIELNFIVGGSGSGKTVISYAAAISSILNKPNDSNSKPGLEGIVLFKTNDIIGGKHRDQGFLPGTAFEKVKPFMKSYMDAHRLLNLNRNGGISFSELLADPYDEGDEFGKRKIHSLKGYNLPKHRKAIEIEHLQYARGRTFENQLIFVDEVQNYSPFEIKQLIERVGEGSKIFLVGDPEQIDNPFLDKDFNGLTYAANIYYGNHPRSAITFFDQNYRSQSAEIMREKKAPQQ